MWFEAKTMPERKQKLSYVWKMNTICLYEVNIKLLITDQLNV